MANNNRHNNQYDNPQGKSKSCCNWRCFCITCCLFVLIVIGIGVGIYFVLNGMGYFNENKPIVDNGEWDQKLTQGFGKSDTSFGFKDISGEYQLVSFNEEFKSFLTAMGIPPFVLPIILSVTETLNITASPEGKWSITRDMGFMKKTNDFKLEEEFTVEWGRNDGIMHSTCNFKIDEHTLVCDSEEKVKGWHFEDKMIFSKLGMINEKYFKEEDIRAKKYYEKVGVPHGKFSSSVGEGMHQIKEQPDEDSPFSSNEDSPFSLDDDPPFFDDEDGLFSDDEDD